MTLQKSIEEKFKELEVQYVNLMAMADYLPEELAEKGKIDFLFRDIKVKIPYDLTELRKTRKLLGKGWKLRQAWGSTKPSYTYRNMAYIHPDFPDIDFEISMDLSEEGSTCRIEKVGEETKEVYKVVCN